MVKPDYSYLAGIVDGEGSILITCYHHHGRKSWRIKLTISNTSKRIIDKVIDAFGGYCTESRRKGANFVLYQWDIYGKHARKALEEIKPYLIEKQAQAELAIKFHIHQVECVKG